MSLLLDTHALLWWLGDDPRLGDKARGRIADGAQDVLVSIVSMWEIVVKQRIGKLDADIAEIGEAVVASGFSRLGIEQAHLERLVDLPRHHRDPFDHLLIAQAAVERSTFVTADRDAARYPIKILSCG